jgi:pimeloyl-ACP methyl ester carboxylesterase
MSEWLSADVTVNGLKVHYYRTGGEKPPFVLAHGATDDGLCWTPVAKVLAEDYDVIMVDALGHGLSDSPEGSNTVNDMGNVLAAVIQALGIEKPLVMGHSMGAVTALALAGLHPDLPKAILLEDPPNWWKPVEPPKEDAPRNNSRVNWFESLRTKTREEIMADGREQNPDWSEEEFGPWADSKMRFVAHDPAKTPFSRVLPEDFPATLAKIICPTLLMVADTTRGSIVREEDIPGFMKLVPQAVVERFADAGHNIRRDQYQHYMTTIKKFLAALDA